MLSYRGGRQDIGVWKGCKLIRLQVVVPEASFSVSDESDEDCRDLKTPDFKSRGIFRLKGPLEVIFDTKLMGHVWDSGV